MSKENAIRLFEQKQVRTHWDEEKELWYISVIDVIEVLTDSIDPQAYWRKLKQRLKEEGNETVTNLHGLKMRARDGKMRVTDVADTELILNMLAEVSTKDISQEESPETFEESAKIAKRGGNVANVARLELEVQTGKKVVTSLNAKSALKVKDTKQIGNKKPKDK